MLLEALVVGHELPGPAVAVGHQPIEHPLELAVLALLARVLLEHGLDKCGGHLVVVVAEARHGVRHEREVYAGGGGLPVLLRVGPRDLGQLLELLVSVCDVLDKRLDPVQVGLPHQDQASRPGLALHLLLRLGLLLLLQLGHLVLEGGFLRRRDRVSRRDSPRDHEPLHAPGTARGPAGPRQGGCAGSPGT